MARDRSGSSATALCLGSASCASASSAGPARPAAASRPGWPASATRSSSARARSTGRWRPATASSSTGPSSTERLHYGDNIAAADCDLVVIATPWDSAATTAQEHSTALQGKVVISMANALVRVGHEFQPLVPPRGSVAAHVQAAVPGCHVVAALHHLPAKELGHLGEPIDSDVLICGDDPAAVRTVSEIVAKIPGCRPLDAGELSNATAIEAFTAVLLQLNVRYKTRVAPKLTGIKRDPRAVRPDDDRRRPSRPPMRLHDTARRAVVPFEPGPNVLMYTCGITPYDATHLGHAATFLAYDVLQRRLIDRGHTVTCVRNVTDVDDPLFAKARQLGVHYLDLAAGEEARFEADMEALNALPVASTPRASSAIPDIRGFIGMVLDRGLRLPGRRRGVLRRHQVRVVRVGQPLHRGARCSSSPASAAATSTTRTSGTRSTSCCGSRRRPTSRRGTRCGARAVRAGTSSAAPWRCASWARRSTCTAAAPT